MVIDMHPGVAALVLVILAWFIWRATRQCPKCYNPNDFK